MRSRTERLIGHTGTETRPRLLRETAVRNIRQCLGRTVRLGNESYLTVLFKKATANYVPAAAVIRRWRALSGFIGRKECADGLLSLKLKPEA